MRLWISSKLNASRNLDILDHADLFNFDPLIYSACLCEHHVILKLQKLLRNSGTLTGVQKKDVIREECSTVSSSHRTTGSQMTVCFF